MKAYLLISHGSHISIVQDEVAHLVNKLRDKSSAEIIEWAFLKIGSPTVVEGVGKCIQQGATEVIILLNFLNSGRYVEQDIPKAVDEARQKYPDIPIHITKPIGQHQRMDELFLDVIEC